MEIKDVEKLAELARIEISKEEKEGILKDLQGILGYVDQVQMAPVGARGSTQMGTQINADEISVILINVMREDKEPHQTGIYTDKILAEAETKDGYVKVRKIL